MNPPRHRPHARTDPPQQTAIDAAAADWLIAHDRGLSANQQAEFGRWLAADVRHRATWTEAQGAWARLDRLPELVPLVARSGTPVRRRVWPAAVGGLAAALLIGLFIWSGLKRSASTPHSPAVVRLVPQQRVLSDGTRVELNADSDVEEQFTSGERRVRLVRGEAHFTVVKNPRRPFVVAAGSVAVRAVGTAFNVRLDHAQVEVLVTHGQVQLDPPRNISAPPRENQLTPTSIADASARMTTPPPPLLEAGQRAIVGLAPEALPPQVTVVSSDEIARTLAWQALRLQFHDMPLGKVAVEFNRHNRTRLVVEASAVDTLVAGSFQAENVELFVRFLEQAFNIAADRRANGTIVLRKAP